MFYIEQQLNNKTQLQTLCQKEVSTPSHSCQVLGPPVLTTIVPSTYIYIIPAPEQPFSVLCSKQPIVEPSPVHSHPSLSPSSAALSHCHAFHSFLPLRSLWLASSLFACYTLHANRVPPFGQWYITKSVLRLQFFIVSQRSCLAWDTHRAVAVYISTPVRLVSCQKVVFVRFRCFVLLSPRRTLLHLRMCQMFVCLFVGL